MLRWLSMVRGGGALLALLLLALLVTLITAASLERAKYFTDGHLAPLTWEYGYHFQDRELAPDEALALPFTPAAFTEPSAPFGTPHQWHRVALQNPGDQTHSLVMVIDNPLADLIEIYELPKADTRGAAGSIQLRETLGERSRTATPEQRRLPHFSFDVAAGQAREFLVHYRADGTPLFPLTVLTQEQYDDINALTDRAYGGFFGIILIVVCYSIMIYLGVKDRAYLAYAYYGLAVLLSFGITGGYLGELLPAGFSARLSEQIITINGLTVIAALQFALYFLQFDREGRRYFQVAQWYSALLLALSLSAVALPERLTGQLFALLHVITYLWVVVLLAYRFRERFSWTRYYLVSWIPLLISSALVSGLFQGSIPYDFMLRLAALAAIVFEIAFMAVALADRLSKLERERLYAATHDEELELPLPMLLESALAAKLDGARPGEICILSVEVSNYHEVTPFLSAAEFRAVMRALVEELSNWLGSRLRLAPIDAAEPNASVAGLSASEVLCFLVEGESRTALASALEELAKRDNFNPLPAKIPYRLECLFGAAFNDRRYTAASDLINESRIALARAKASRKDYWIFSGKDFAEGERRVRLAQDLDAALESEELELYHQPQLCLEHTDTYPSELLLRWRHPELGQIPPDELVKIAEQTGQIRRLTDWVVREAARQGRQFLDEFGVDALMSINVSASDLERRDFAGDVLIIIEAQGLRPAQFTIEITETMRMGDPELLENTARDLRRCGFRLAVDDFGTGYAAMSYAISHDVQEVKIDRSFLKEYPENRRYQTVVDTILRMAAELDSQAVAEGVERSAQAVALRDRGCSHLQGYAFARPMSLQHYFQWIRNDRQQAIASLFDTGSEHDL